MSGIKEKLKNQAGETITEVLVALLISTFALMMLALMITSAQNSVSKSREALEKYYASSTTPGSLAITVTLEDKVEETGKTVFATYKSTAASSDSKSLGGKTVISFKDVTLKREETSTP